MLFIHLKCYIEWRFKNIFCVSLNIKCKQAVFNIYNTNDIQSIYTTLKSNKSSRVQTRIDII